MIRKKPLFTLASTLLIYFFYVSFLYAQSPRSCQEGDYWIFKVDGKNPTVSRSDEVNGVFTIRCTGGSPLLEEGNLNHFVNVIPSVPGLTPEGRVPLVVEKGKGVFSRYPKNNWLMG